MKWDKSKLRVGDKFVLKQNPRLIIDFEWNVVELYNTIFEVKQIKKNRKLDDCILLSYDKNGFMYKKWSMDDEFLNKYFDEL